MTQSTAFKLALIIGARPNLPKAWTFLRAIEKARLESQVVHSGQQPDPHMVEGIAAELHIEIDTYLGVGAGRSDGGQMALLGEAMAGYLVTRPIDAVVVVGDVNTALAAAITAARRDLPVIHLEAGVRTHAADPEEINRRIVTACSEFHLAPSHEARDELRREGIASERIFVIGNAMAEPFLEYSDARDGSRILGELGVEANGYLLVTIHKAASLSSIHWVADALTALSSKQRVVFPCHPHTRDQLIAAGFRVERTPGLMVTRPLPYVDFGRLLVDARAVVTDSAGVQEECAIAERQCVTIGPLPPRPLTAESGSNRTAGCDIDRAVHLTGAPAQGVRRPILWDTGVSDRLSTALLEIRDALRRSGPRPRWQTR